jgi:hypothetical protein
VLSWHADLTVVHAWVWVGVVHTTCHSRLSAQTSLSSSLVHTQPAPPTSHRTTCHSTPRRCQNTFFWPLWPACMMCVLGVMFVAIVRRCRLRSRAHSIAMVMVQVALRDRVHAWEGCCEGRVVTHNGQMKSSTRAHTKSLANCWSDISLR